MEYELRRSKRKTISIMVRDAKVQVRAPLGVAKKQIDEFVHSKENWISKQIKSQRENMETKKRFQLSPESNISFLGKKVLLADFIEINNKYMEHDQLLAMTKLFYRRKAYDIIYEKVRQWSDAMNISPGGVRITGARTRWGSCNSKGNLNFSWYLVMASEEQIDYVVVHELAHIKEMNHSERFWSIVRRYIPDYQERRKLLKLLNRRLVSENWD